MARRPVGIAPTVSLTLASAFWAIGTVLSKDLLQAVPPITFLILQLWPSVVLLWLLVLARGAPAAGLRQLGPIALLGWLNPGLSYTLSMFGLTTTTASVATLLWAAEPALIVAAAWIVLREEVTMRLLAFTAAAAAGVLLVSGASGPDGSALDGWGAGLILAGVLCCAIYTVFSRRLAPTLDPLLTVAVQQTVGLAWALAIWPLELRDNPLAQLLTLPSASILGAAASGLIYYAAAFWCYLNALRSVPASTAGMFLNMTPMFGIAAAHWLLDERLSLGQWLGAVIILLSVAGLLAWSEPRKAPAP